LGRIVYAASTEQFTRWRAELGAKPGRVRALAIQEVIEDTVVDGPADEFAERIKALHVAHYRKAGAQQ
jgi:hypothetical protein